MRARGLACSSLNVCPLLYSWCCSRREPSCSPVGVQEDRHLHWRCLHLRPSSATHVDSLPLLRAAHGSPVGGREQSRKVKTSEWRKESSTNAIGTHVRSRGGRARADRRRARGGKREARRARGRRALTAGVACRLREARLDHLGVSGTRVRDLSLTFAVVSPVLGRYDPKLRVEWQA
jgi:hypothetical protein